MAAALAPILAELIGSVIAMYGARKGAGYLAKKLGSKTLTGAAKGRGIAGLGLEAGAGIGGAMGVGALLRGGESEAEGEDVGFPEALAATFAGRLSENSEMAEASTNSKSLGLQDLASRSLGAPARHQELVDSIMGDQMEQARSVAYRPLPSVMELMSVLNG
jgi:hypothetical protein